MKTIKFITIAILLFTVKPIFSQNFIEETNTPFVGVNGLKSMQLVDVDNDGDLDLAGISGNTTAKLFKNNGQGVFSEELNGFIIDAIENLRFVDIDGDGDKDIFIIRKVGTTTVVWVYDIYENNGIGVFTKHQITGLTTNFNSTTSVPLQFDFGDVDGDGDMDLTLSGFTSQFSAKIWRYDGNYTFSQLFSSILQATNGATRFADLDNDGDQDLIVIGQTTNGQAYHKFFNTGTGTFTFANADSLEGAFYGDFDLGDLDGDADLDVVQVGSNRSTSLMTTHRNNGAGHFSSYVGVLAPNYTLFSTVKLADFDNDGDLDIVASCASANPNTNIFLNSGSGMFSPMSGQNFGSVDFWTEVQVGDIDGDMDIDIILSYKSSSTNVQVTKIFKNNLNTLSVIKNEFNKVAIHPNPTTSVLNIKMKGNPKQATIYNTLGVKIFQTQSKNINTSNLKTGMYLLTIEDQIGNITTKRFIKQ